MQAEDEEGERLPDEAGKRRLGKGAKPTVFFVAGGYSPCAAKTSSHFFTFPHYPYLVLPLPEAFDFLERCLLHPYDDDHY